MSTILIDVLVGFMLVLFAAMALGPLFISSSSNAQPTPNSAEDRVISVSPVPMIDRVRPMAENQPHSLIGDPPASRPDHREAA